MVLLVLCFAGTTLRSPGNLAGTQALVTAGAMRLVSQHWLAAAASWQSIWAPPAAAIRLRDSRCCATRVCPTLTQQASRAAITGSV